MKIDLTPEELRMLRESVYRRYKQTSDAYEMANALYNMHPELEKYQRMRNEALQKREKNLKLLDKIIECTEE